MLRILLAEDHAMVREGLALLINGQHDMAVVAQATNGLEAVRLARESAPDVAVIDISMPELGGAEATQQILAECSGVRVLALTRHTDASYLRQMIKAGSAGFVLKRSVPETLVRAIRVVAEGGMHVEPDLGGRLLQQVLHAPASPREASRAVVLSRREEEVLRAIAWGSTTKEVAARLGINMKTVESYKASATEKLGLRTRAEIVRFAVGQGWLSDDSVGE